MDYFCYLCFMFVFVYAVLSVPCNLLITFLEKADPLALLRGVYSCVFRHFPIWCPGSDVVLDCTDS